jgi:hypothetical protein
MTQVKLDSKLGGGPAAAIESHVPALYARQGCRIVAVVELAHEERTQPAPDSDKEPSVKMRISSMEIAAKEQEPAIREAMRALYLQRTATGTLDEHGQMVLTESTIQLTAGLLADVEAARLRVGMEHWMRYARQAASSQKLTDAEVRSEMRAVADGMAAVLSRAAVLGETD